MYSSVDLVRELSGFDDSTKIPDAMVRGKISIADSMIDGKVTYRYALPLPYHKTTSVTFSGDATTSGTITVTINSVGYALSVSNEDSASVIADALRTALESVETLITDAIGSGPTVLLVSAEDSSDTTTASAQVTVSSITALAGVENSISSTTNRYPPIIQQISAEIAAGLLLIDNYGVEQQDGRPTEGMVRIQQAEKILKQIQGSGAKEDAYQRIYDEVSKTEIAQGSESDAESYPNYDSFSDTSDPTLPRVEIDQKF